MAEPVYICPKCDGPMTRRAKTCRGCREYRGAVSGRWKHADDISISTGRTRAKMLYPELGTCEYADCERPAVDRHHVDGNTANNTRGNLAFLCRRHHMESDGRLAKQRRLLRIYRAANLKHPRRRADSSRELDPQAISLREAGMTYMQIAREMGESKSQAFRRCNRESIDLAPAGGGFGVGEDSDDIPFGPSLV